MRASTSASQAWGSTSLSFAGDDQAVHEGGALAAAIGAGEQPRLAAECHAAQSPLGGIVGEADPAVVEEAGEGGPALEHVVDGLGDVGVARQLAPLARASRLRARRPAVRSAAWRTASRCSAGSPLMPRSISNSASMRCTASSAIGEITGGVRPRALRRAAASISASSKNLRRRVGPAGRLE